MTARVLAGIVFLQLERYAEAVACFDLLLTIDPTNIGAMVNQAYALNGLYRHDDAISVCNRALALKPDCKIALVNCGVASGCLNRHADALDYFDRALVLDPQDTGVLNNRGLVLLKLRRFDDALSCFSSALKITPDSPEILTNCGFTLRKLGRYSEALASYEHAISIQSDFGEAIWNETLCKLMLGQFDVSATKLEWLWTKGFLGRKAPGISCPVWTGQQDLNGKSILLHEHQGLGDAILFARYAQRVAEKGATVYLDVVPPLKHLMKRIQGVNRVLNSSEPHPAMDFQCSLSSLPFAFGTTFSTIPAPIPYLSIEKEVIASWRAKLALGDEKLVGVCWRGSPHYSDDAERSIEFSLFASMFSVPGVRFVSLQKELTDVEFPLANKLPQFVHSGAEFMSTAEIVAALDLIISVDTVWAHCAGALGTPVWVLSPFVPHWFWFIEREDSPWYPTARLFRQSEIGNWHGVIRKVKEALSRETPSIATSARF